MEFVPCAAARPLGLQVVVSYMAGPGQAPGGRLPGKCPRLDLETVNDAARGSLFMRFLLPGFAFKAVVIGGGLPRRARGCRCVWPVPEIVD